jgi:copper(I)-binding protein
MKLVLATIVAAFAVLAAGCDGGSNATGTAAPAATVRLPLVSGRPGVAYGSVPVEGDRGALVSVTSPRIGRIEMHESMSQGGMSSMRPLPRIPAREGEDIRFEPGGKHLMLFEMDPALRPGERLLLTFRFERGAPETVPATVVAANRQGPR